MSAQPEDRAETARWETEALRTERAAMGQCVHGLPQGSRPGTCPDCRKPPPDPRGGYVYRPSRQERHECPLPAEWEEGAVWRCPEGHLWVVDDACDCRGRFERHGGRGMHIMGLAWRPATWWERRRWGGITIGAATRARLDMANGNRAPGARALKAPPPAAGVLPADYDG